MASASSRSETTTSTLRNFATGRSDYPNQINNALVFPGVFRGALDVQARQINEAMKLAAATALAETVPPSALSEDYIIPSVFDKEIVPRVAKAVATAARETGVEFRFNARFTGIDRDGNRIQRVTYQADGKDFEIVTR